MQQWSLLINDTDIIGRAYWRRKGKLLPKSKQRITIFIAKIAQFSLIEAHDLGLDAKKAFVEFLDMMSRTELHEHLHIFFANTNDHPFSERKCEFWADKSLPVVAEIVAPAYIYCYEEIHQWFEEQIAKLIKENEESKVCH